MDLSNNPKRLRDIARKFLKGTISEDEQNEFDAWFNEHQIDTSNQISVDQTEEEHRQVIFERIRQEIKYFGNAKVRSLWPRIAAAASVILIISAGGLFLKHRKQANVQVAQNKYDIPPGRNKAIIKLANGKQINVTDAKNGLLAQRGNITITKSGDGKLVYKNSGGSTGAMAYDTIIVPRSGQHQVNFPDGSIAWLNADTKLRVPENFENSDRMVELISGEADFHVAHNVKKPFTVIARGQITKDIGTEFNINAYPDEPAIKTTLLEGNIRVNKNKQFVILKPGQQTIVIAGYPHIRVQEADTDEALAWKNGKFIFNSTSLENIMRQLSRWYDVEVIYENNELKTKKFSAISTRFANASQILHNLELTGDVKFHMEGKTIKVSNR